MTADESAGEIKNFLTPATYARLDLEQSFRSHSLYGYIAWLTKRLPGEALSVRPDIGVRREKTFIQHQGRILMVAESVSAPAMALRKRATFDALSVRLRP
jgi:hypothetical protein